MKIKFYFEPKNGVFYIKCPFCEALPSDYDFQIDDYCTQPMLWCEKCEARSFLNITEEYLREIEKEYYVSKSVIKTIKLEVLYDSKKKIVDVIRFDSNLLLVKEVVNHILLIYKTKTKLSEKKIRKFVKSDYSEELASKYGIVKRDEDADLSCDSGFLPLTCNSYNTENPETPYPDNFDMSHDGVIVLCFCEDNKRCWYWGD